MHLKPSIDIQSSNARDGMIGGMAPKLIYIRRQGGEKSETHPGVYVEQGVFTISEDQAVAAVLSPSREPNAPNDVISGMACAHAAPLPKDHQWPLRPWLQCGLKIMSADRMFEK